MPASISTRDSYLDAQPDRPALRIGSSIQEALHSIAHYPYLEAIQSELTRPSGVEVRTRLIPSYRIVSMVGDVPEIIGVLQTSRDIASTISRRLQ